VIMSAFTDFDLLPSLQETLKEKGFKEPTEIQERAIPALLSERSIVGVAETGGGKTLAYVLPVLHMLKTLENRGLRIADDGQPRAIVVVPTRELGEQVSKVFKPFTHTTRLRVRTLLGGTTPEVAKRNIQGQFEVLVATPGRLVKFLDRKLLSFSDVRILIFDEADQMLDQGFLPDAARISNECPPSRQLALFSATVSPTVQKLIDDMFAGADVIRSEGHHRLVASLTTLNRKVIHGDRFKLLEEILKESKSDKVSGGTMIFTNTRAQCDELAERVEKIKLSFAIYRGEMDKVERRANLKAFRDGKIDFLISTDLASRGLDVEHVGRVLNYHLPQQMENYIHRVGRTARAGRPGTVINFVTERDQPFIDQLNALEQGQKPRQSKK
jgi:ATP-dependent RNA helicase RhlE